MALRIVALIAAHNEEQSIVDTLVSLMFQSRPLDQVVVALDNCTDATLEQVRRVSGVTCFETDRNSAKKPGALNQGWSRYCQDADLVVCVDADTELDVNAIAEWERDFAADGNLGGCSAKFTMPVRKSMTGFERFLVRLQRAEFAKWTDLALRRGRTSVLAGTACCFRNGALRDVVRGAIAVGERWREGPWIETSLVEDFELTYRMRGRGWKTQVSRKVRASTDAMTDLGSLWAQRMKWQTGTVQDLLAFGFNRLTWYDWWQQAQGVISIVVRFAWVTLLVVAAATGQLHLRPLWLIPPVLFLANDIKQSFRIPNRTAADVLMAGLLFPQEMFAFMRGGWFGIAWLRVLSERVFGIEQRDLWQIQARAETAGASL